MRFFRIDAHPSRWGGLVLSSLVFLILIGAYFTAAHRRHVDNPQDKIMPLASELLHGVKSVAWDKDREDQVRLWVDTCASGKRYFFAYLIIFLAIPSGVLLGVFPYLEALLLRFFIVLHKIPALSVLPIILIVAGIGELSKVMIVVIGIFPGVFLDAYRKATEIPEEQIHKAKTLGATDLEVALRVVLPQVFPRALDTIRLTFGPAAIMLIAAEAIAASEGLGYRIFVVRRFMAMDIIIPYVLWIAGVLFVLDALTSMWVRRYRWLDES